MVVKRIIRPAVKKKFPYGLSKKDFSLACKIAKEEGVLPIEAARHVKRHRIESRHECPDY